MVDTPAIGAQSAPANVGAPFTEARLRSQRTLGEARLRATAMADQPDNAEMRAAVKRLSRLLDAGVPLKTNVPRGYYLSFTV